MDIAILLAVLKRTLIAGTPLLLGTLGEIIAERSGVMNLGVEGMMSVGAVTGFIVTFTSGNPYLGMISAVIVTAAFSQIHAIVSISLQANQVVSGLALSMLGIGISVLWGKPYIGRPLHSKFGEISIPFLSDIPFIGELIFNQTLFFYLALIIGFIAWFMLYKTRPGIALRSVGENPKASEAQGISVVLYRYIAVGIGGALAGLAGCHLSISYSKSWIEGIVAGRGWIVIALTIFAAWNPAKAFMGAFLFGGIFVLQYLLQPLGISPSILAMLPYVTTLIVLILFAIGKESRKKLHAPAMLGEMYRRGER
ncbi:MAG: ABC transporter permease [Spirochaetes bacterium]|nr:ABC transporter permease [Spirochaetota bacterium]